MRYRPEKIPSTRIVLLTDLFISYCWENVLSLGVYSIPVHYFFLIYIVSIRWVVFLLCGRKTYETLTSAVSEKLSTFDHMVTSHVFWGMASILKSEFRNIVHVVAMAALGFCSVNKRIIRPLHLPRILSIQTIIIVQYRDTVVVFIFTPSTALSNVLL